MKRGLRLEYATLSWNVVGVVVLAVAAIRASSVALVGFGLDSLIEIFASVVVIWEASHPQKSLLGIAWLASTVVVMLLLAWGKHMTGRSLGNPVLSKEAHVTLIDAVLAGAVLAGLALNAMARLWWADPLAGLVIVYYGLREGQGAWR
jgi:divalent metal cation (Fe/Co/Zn/Cd) transporter